MSEELDRLQHLEEELFAAREGIEVLWLKMGEVCSEIIRSKLYRLKQDDEGNYFRTAKSYFMHLDKQFQERGLNMGYTTINRFVVDYRLYKEEMGLEDEDLILLGRTNLYNMAPAVNKLKKEQGPEAAQEFVHGIVDAARANSGIPTHEVAVAIDEATGRVNKGLEAEFIDGIFGRRLKRLVLWWGGSAVDVLKQEVTEEQGLWLARRLSVKV